MIEQIPPAVERAYAHLGTWTKINVLDMGLINKTYVLETLNNKYILQEVSPIFDVTIHDDCEVVGKHLQRHGMKAPSLVPTGEGDLFCRDNKRVFRILTLIEGQSFHNIRSLKMAEQAGIIVGKFHQAVLDLDYEYRSQRRHGGDYPFHLGNLTAALKAHPNHDYFAKVEPLALQMIEHMRKLTLGLTTTMRHVHGDPKISNILFNDEDEAVCLVDFDTLSKHGWSLEIGDALRSWCNPYKEDDPSARVDLKIAEYALKGYGQQMKGMLSDKELVEACIHAPAITLCVAIRYLTDVLNEKYWAYDSSRFARAAEHNWLRAQAMYRLFQDFIQHRAVLKDLINSLLR